MSSLTHLRGVALREAERIAATQTALVVAGIRAEPDAEQLKRAEDFAAIARFFDLVSADLDLKEQFRAAALARLPRNEGAGS